MKVGIFVLILKSCTSVFTCCWHITMFCNMLKILKHCNGENVLIHIHCCMLFDQRKHVELVYMLKEKHYYSMMLASIACTNQRILWVSCLHPSSGVNSQWQYWWKFIYIWWLEAAMNICSCTYSLWQAFNPFSTRTHIQPLFQVWQA